MSLSTESLKNILRNTIIDNILIVSAVLATVAVISAQIRAATIGWGSRDLLQISVVGSFIMLALFRKKLNEYIKAIILISLFSCGGFSGFYTLGLIAGTIFVFPAAAVVTAIFYSKKATLIYIITAFLIFLIVAARFCSPTAGLLPDANHLMKNYFHWLTYGLCILFFFGVSFVTIYSYRRMTEILMEKINHQRDELAKANEKLIQASKNVKTLTGLLPICASCKKIRDDKGYWKQIELYISEHSEADFSHGICPECMKIHYPNVHDQLNLNEKSKT